MKVKVIGNASRLLNSLEEELSNAKNSLLGGTCKVDREEFLNIIAAIKESLPKELSEALWIIDNSNRIQDQAQEASARIIEEAREKALALIDENEIKKQAVYEANEIRESVYKQSNDMYNEAKALIEKMYQDVDYSLTRAAEYIESCRQSFSGEEE